MGIGMLVSLCYNRLIKHAQTVNNFCGFLFPCCTLNLFRLVYSETRKEKNSHIKSKLFPFGADPN